MKVMLINGSSNSNGCTFRALKEIETVLNKEKIETEVIQLGSGAVKDCIGCRACVQNDNKCIFNDDTVNEIIEKAKTSDGFVFGSPVYYAHPSGRLLSVLDRVFYAGSKFFAYKPGAAVVSARRAGTTAAVDVINKYFTINNMPVVSSQYWNMVHGSKQDDVEKDLEGLQIMRTIGKNMAWLLNALKSEHPEPEIKIMTNFIR
ncbi:flavodoxin family protein [Candidatus Ruminimicrobium bovinum]|uniref:flavodoxin family protein n=1 Tax=Candidatus Ruminimicrobium bovinum TaxID=3242779 RepID=UPI0039B946BE